MRGDVALTTCTHRKEYMFVNPPVLFAVYQDIQFDAGKNTSGVSDKLNRS